MNINTEKNMMKKINNAMPAVLFLIIAASAWLGSCPQASAAESPPERMTYQGFLVDGNGVALGNDSPDNYEVIFRIYTAQSGGVRKWSEQQTVTVDKGYFSVLLGEGTPVDGEASSTLSSVFTGSDASERFIAITVKGIGSGGSDIDILPRLQLVTSPYAFMAANIVPNAINSASIADASITSVDILNSSIVGADIANNTITGGNILNNSIISADIQDSTITGVDIADETITAADLAANSVYASEIAAGAVGTSELASNIQLNGSIGINGRASNIGLYVRPEAGDTYSRWVTDLDGNYTLFQNSDGLMGLVRRVNFNQNGLEVFRLACTTPNSGFDYWQIAIDTDDPGGTDEDLFFYLNGSLKGWIDADGSGFKGNSDLRLKQDIVSLENVLPRALQLQPKLYHFKDNPNGALQIGLIAQEVLPYFPEVVDEGEEYLGLAYNRVGVIAIGAIKELNQKVETLEAEKNALQERLDALEARIQSLEP